jgi:hypothetical protein
LKDQDVDGKIILKCIFERFDAGMDWIDLAEDVVNAVINIRVL